MLSLLGVALIVTQGSFTTLPPSSVGAGDAWILGGIVIYALYPPLLRRRPVVHPLSLLVAVMGIGSLMMLPFYVWEIAAGATIRGGLASLAAMAYTAVLPSFIAFLFFNRGVELIGAGRAGQSVHLIPVLGMALALLFLGERFHLYHALGATATTAGIFLASLQMGTAQRPLPHKAPTQSAELRAARSHILCNTEIGPDDRPKHLTVAESSTLSSPLIDGALAIERHVPESARRLPIGDAVQSQVFERAIIHGEQEAALVAHLQRQLKRPQKPHDAPYGAREPAWAV